MKAAIIGSRNLYVNLEDYLPDGISLVISGGARGIDTLAEAYADRKKITKLILKPDYEKYGSSAPFVRNRLIVDGADIVIAFWDGVSRGTKYTIEYAKKQGKRVIVHQP